MSIRDGAHTLIAAPTGSGKTLAAFLAAIDSLFSEGLQAGALPDEVRVVYVSPLKALSADISKNLAQPLKGICEEAERIGVDLPHIRSALRSGDTTSAARASMLRTPPHILVTTPESLYLLLTARKSREILRTAKTVIVDEIHAVIESRRGAHLALSLERLQHVAEGPLQRIGLSATQHPIETVARFLTGSAHGPQSTPSDCTVIDVGHMREIDLELALPDSPLESVMSHEVWEEVYGRLASLIGLHETTIVFVNTRRMAERLTRHLMERLGDNSVTTHHGSLSKEHRLDAEERLKSGRLKALVATASLELGIDIGHVDLVCQIGSPRWISTLLQRVGRSGHTVQNTPKGRLFPLTRDDLVECAALLRAAGAGNLDEIAIPDGPLDVLAQQIVAEVAAEPWSERGLFECYRRAYPYASLRFNQFHEIIETVARGYATSRGRRGALIHYDSVGQFLRPRRLSRITALTSGGAIPDNADYRVILEPADIFIGTINEDFAIESSVGDIFQLGNASWRIEKVESGTVRVSDAAGEPPTIPFWLGEAPGRSDQLSDAVSKFHQDVEAKLAEKTEGLKSLNNIVSLPSEASEQIIHYLRSAYHLLGLLPTKKTLILERFFDESGGMQLVLHAPFGIRINRAWGLALRKKFCRRFNFELQAAASDNAVLLSLGPQHSFPLDDVFRYLNSGTVENVLVQAVLDAPLFQTRWRWNATISLAVPRNRGGRKIPPPLQRMQAEDLLAAVFPDAGACLENIAGDRELPDHPIVNQAIKDCLYEAMDLKGLIQVLKNIESGKIRCVSRDTPEPSVLSHEILNANPYAFLDPAPLEERRAQSALRRHAFEPSKANEIGALDPAAISEVRNQAWPTVRDVDELHDALLIGGFLTQDEIEHHRWEAMISKLVAQGRAIKKDVSSNRSIVGLWFAIERVEEFESRQPARIADLLRSRLQLLGPVTARSLSADSGLPLSTVESALLFLENEGTVLRGYFGSERELEWCDRALLARIHRLTIKRLRTEIKPVAVSDYIRFLFAWQHVSSEYRMEGVSGLQAVLAQLDGYEIAAGAWEAEVLSRRVRDYDPAMLDALCLTGQVWWGRLSTSESSNGAPSRPIRTTPITIALPESVESWAVLSGSEPGAPTSSYAKNVYDVLSENGAIFFRDIVRESGLIGSQVEYALAELVGLGMISADGFTGLRVLLTPSAKRRPLSRTAKRRTRTVPFGMESAGRWFVVRHHSADTDLAAFDRDAALEKQARTLLLRYGIVFRRLLARETKLAPWWELTRMYRVLEARGEIRGGRFVGGMSGEQYALPEAIGTLRSIRKSQADSEIVVISGADPLNLTGTIHPGERIASIMTNRIAYHNGMPIASLEAGKLRSFTNKSIEAKTKSSLLAGWSTPALKRYWNYTRRAPKNPKETTAGS